MQLQQVKSKKRFLVAIFKVTDKIAGPKSGSVSQKYGSADPDPDQNVSDPQHWLTQMGI